MPLKKHTKGNDAALPSFGATTRVAVAFWFLGTMECVTVALCLLSVMTRVVAAFCFLGVEVCVAMAFVGTARVVAGGGNFTAWPLVGLGLLTQRTL